MEKSTTEEQKGTELNKETEILKETGIEKEGEIGKETRIGKGEKEMRTETKKGQEKEIVTGIKEEKRTLKIQKGQNKRAPLTDPKKVTEAEKDGKKRNMIRRNEETEMQKKVKIRRVSRKGETDTENVTGVKRGKKNGIGVKT